MLIVCWSAKSIGAPAASTRTATTAAPQEAGAPTLAAVWKSEVTWACCCHRQSWSSWVPCCWGCYSNCHGSYSGRVLLGQEPRSLHSPIVSAFTTSGKREKGFSLCLPKSHQGLSLAKPNGKPTDKEIREKPPAPCYTEDSIIGWE